MNNVRNEEVLRLTAIHRVYILHRSNYAKIALIIRVVFII